MYRLTKGDDYILLIVYIDDLLYIGSTDNVATWFEGELKRYLTLTVSSTVTQYLGLNIQEEEGTIYLNAAKYADTIAKRFALTPATISTPYRYTAGSHKEDSAPLKPAGICNYQRKLGCLLFAAVTCRPDLSYSARPTKENFGGGGGGGGGSGGGGGGSGGAGRGSTQRSGSGGGQRQEQQRSGETPSSQQLREWYTGRQRDAWRHQFPGATEIPRWGDLSRAGVAVFDLDYDAILAAMYALSTSDESDCYLCLPPDPGGEVAALGASVSAASGAGESALSGTTSAQVLHTFTLESGASRSFFRDCTTLTPLSRPVGVSLADPSGGPVLATFSTVLPCPAAPSGTL
ncbi:unnamed protein product [Closterium sp. NIES-54]